MLRIIPTGTITAGLSHRFREATLAQLVAAAEELDEMGHADFRYALNFGHANGQLTRVDLTMRLTIDMPTWTQAVRRPQAERDEWERFLRALRVHEDGHIAICRPEAPTTYERLLAATPDTINDVLNEETERIRALNRAYDTRTGHGTTQQTPHGTTVIQIP